MKAFRFSKVGGDLAVYDLVETAGGASCDCPDFVFRREGLDPAGCKHVKACRMLGLFSGAPEPASPDDDARAAYDDAREAESRQVEPAPCCEPSGPDACEACVNVHTRPDDLSGPDWEDGFRYELGPDDAPEPDLADRIDVESRRYRTLGTPFGDLLAHHLEGLADRVRFLEARTIADYEDRYQALLDGVRDEAEARQAARV